MEVNMLSKGNPLAEKKIIWLIRGVGVTAVVGLLAASAPLVWAAVSAGTGLLTLAAMAALGLTALQVLPLGMQRLENHLLALRKVEARANPIEQLQNECLRREQRLQAFRKALVTIGGQIENMDQMVSERSHLDPGHVLDRQKRALKRMTQFYECNLVRLNEAQSAMQDFRHQIKQKMFEWDFAQAGQVVMSALRPGELDELMQDLLTDEALQSVQNRFNTVFAELDVDMRALNSPALGLLERTGMEQLDPITVKETFQLRSQT